MSKRQCTGLGTRWRVCCAQGSRYIDIGAIGNGLHRMKLSARREASDGHRHLHRCIHDDYPDSSHGIPHPQLSTVSPYPYSIMPNVVMQDLTLFAHLRTGADSSADRPGNFGSFVPTSGRSGGLCGDAVPVAGWQIGDHVLGKIPGVHVAAQTGADKVRAERKIDSPRSAHTGLGAYSFLLRSILAPASPAPRPPSMSMVVGSGIGAISSTVTISISRSS